MENSEDIRRRKGKNSNAGKKPDWLVSLCSAQLTLAAAGVAVLLMIMRFSPVSFYAMQAGFNKIMQVDMSVSQVIGAIKQIADLSSKPDSEELTEAEMESVESAGQGGEDIRLYEAQENICFAPFSSTVEVVTPVKGEVTSPFGYRKHPITGKFGIHNGTDISAPEGTPIAAAMNGTVEQVGCNNVRGNFVLLSHGTSTKTLYMHCSEVLVDEGTVIRAGEIIAKVGSTGLSTGPHLHFSISIGGKYCNPEWVLNDL